MRAFCERRGADVWLREGGMLTVATTARQEAAVDREVELARSLGAADECVPLDRDALAARVASPVFRSAAFCRECATVQPARPCSRCGRRRWTPASESTSARR